MLGFPAAHEESANLHDWSLPNLYQGAWNLRIPLATVRGLYENGVGCKIAIYILLAAKICDKPSEFGMLYFHLCLDKPILPHEKDLSNVWGLSLGMIRYVCPPRNSAVQGKTTAGVFWGSRHNMDSAAVAQSQILKNWDPLVHLWIADA